MKTIIVSMASGVTLSDIVQLGEVFREVHLVVPTMTSGTDVYIQGSCCGTIFKRIYEKVIVDGTPNPKIVFTPEYVPSSVTNCIVDLHHPFTYIKIELTTAMTATAPTFRVICSDIIT
jgi:hypothetical protein